MKKIILSTIVLAALTVAFSLNASPERDRGLGFSDSQMCCSMGKSCCSKHCHNQCASDKEHCNKCCAPKTACMKDGAAKDTAACMTKDSEAAAASETAVPVVPATETSAPAPEAPAAK